MGEYIPPSQLPENQPAPKLTAAQERRMQEASAAQIAAKRAEAQRKLPGMLRELFTRRSDLVSIVDFVGAPVPPPVKPQGWLSRQLSRPSSGPRINVRLYPESSGYTAFNSYVYTGETQHGMIQIPSVHEYRYYRQYKAGFQEVPTQQAGYYTATGPVLVAENGGIRFPSDQYRGLRGTKPVNHLWLT
jgi:hypothetical protein